MKNAVRITVIASAVIAFLANGSSALLFARTNPNPAAVYSWLCLQQRPSGLLGNQENESFCGVYTNALAAICYTRQGDLTRARSIFDFFQANLGIAAEPPGGFPQFWDAETALPHLDSDRWVGDNAWLLIALNHYLYKTRDHTYDAMRQTIAQWLISLQDTDGGILAGYNSSGLMNFKSTEGNLDSYAALIDFPAQRQALRNFLHNDMWIPAEGRFKMGSTVNESSLDSCSFGVGALGSDYAAALQYAETAFFRQKISDATGLLISAFSDFIADDRIWLEGSGQMVVAYRRAGLDSKAFSFRDQLDRAIFESTRRPGTRGMPCHTNDPAWPTGSTEIFVPSQAWYLFAAWAFNPMDYDYPETADFDGGGEVNLQDFARLALYWHYPEAAATIAPLPVPDGTVDAKDLAKLAEYWLAD
ncbi:MAG: hypothetical protein JW720_07760 [Sedimentisphaerales bacterium]|nr:hypothetical protein [Sedimentisphaerales bacterium]